MSTRPPSIRVAIVALVATGFALGLLPPAGGTGGPPETVVRTVPIAAAELAGGPLLASGNELIASRAAWTPRHEVCAGFAFTSVGLTWEQEGDEAVPVSLLWRDDGGERRASRTGGDPDHSPDPGTEESARAGTPLIWTGETRCVDLALELSPGAEVRDVRAVFLNTSGTAHGGSVLGTIAAGLNEGLARLWGAGDAEAAAPRPAIIRRHGWGANESLRNCGPDFAPALKMAYVHHTASGNTYTPDQADDVIRGIYSYHTIGRGYCDIAYNFLVDRFGRIYEGRFGGMTEPVIGGHAMGFNTGSTGVALVGDFTGTEPPKTSIRALKRLLAWRLDVAHLNPKGRATMVSAGGSNQKYEAGEEVRLPVISGHRETGYTTCPGDRLFRKLPAIRRDARSIGLPKIWNARASASAIDLGQEVVRYQAKLSSALAWTVEIVDGAGAMVRSWSGTAQKIDVTWDGFDHSGYPAGEDAYTVTLAARDGPARARPAVFETSLIGACDLTTTPSSPMVVGTDADEVLCGLNGQADVLDGGGGNDILIGFGGNDTLIGGPGQDILIGGAGADTLDGGTGADVLLGGPGNDSLAGGTNADVLHGGPGNDELDGGGGIDTASYARSESAVRVDLTEGTATGEGDDTLTGITNVVGSPQDDTLIGDAQANHLAGGAGDDSLLGGAGADLLEGGPGADLFRGGADDDTIRGNGGSDTVHYGAAEGPVTVDLAQGTGEGEGTDTLGGIENAVGTRFGDTLRGDASANRLVGLGGPDLIEGRGGHDVLVGGPGHDDLRGGGGKDTIRAKDKKRDVVDGGGGVDTAFVDPVDAVRRVEQRR